MLAENGHLTPHRRNQNARRAFWVGLTGLGFIVVMRALYFLSSGGVVRWSPVAAIMERDVTEFVILPIMSVWLVATVWVASRGISYCRKTKCGEVRFSVIGLSFALGQILVYVTPFVLS